MSEDAFNSEREILYKVLFDMKNDMADLKKLVGEIIQKGDIGTAVQGENAQIIKNLYGEHNGMIDQKEELVPSGYGSKHMVNRNEDIQDTEEIMEESLSLADKEIELIRKALDKHNGKRKYAAQELGISERTLYRKIKEYSID